MGRPRTQKPHQRRLNALLREIIDRQYRQHQHICIFETIPYVGEVFKFITFVMALGIFVSMIIKNKDSKTTQAQEVIEAK